MENLNPNDTGMLRLCVFLGILIVMMLAEFLVPARKAPLSRWVRWSGNLGLVVMGALVARVVLPMTLVGIAMWAQTQEVGLFYWLEFNTTLAIIASLVLLDMAIYWQHYWFHHVPFLWRFHQVHHADAHVDTTTGLRFHPVEIAMSLVIKSIIVLALGVPALAVLIFEVALNGFAMFNHANIRLPQKWDKRLGYVLITQRIHRIHHSQISSESNSNFGFSVSWWDRLFGTYISCGQKTDETIDIGQRAFPATKQNANLLNLLLMPFQRQ
ncbi:MAG: sterol desaturase family protein [Pontibacterium sp.]